MASVRLEDVGKVYPNGHVGARDLDLEIQDGEFVVLVGPSGCGKSTTLRLVAGLETPTSGRLFIGDRDVTELPPQDRDIAMVFQNYALYPHLTVRENMGFGLRMRKMASGDIGERVERAASTLGLGDFLERKPAQLSGGQRQRVALGRAIVRDPKAFLLDEPLSNLDAKLRVQMRAELARLHRRFGATMIYVTHDQEEAMTLGQRVAVMWDGTFQQVAPPMEVYTRPANAFVAGFVGSPAMNFFRAELRDGAAGPRVTSDLFHIELEDGTGPAERGGDAAAGAGGEGGGAARDVLLGVRPQDVEVVDEEEGDLATTVDVVEPLGSELLVHLRRGRPGPEVPRAPGRGEEADREGPGEGDDAEGAEEEVRALVPPEAGVEVDRRVGLRFRRDRLHLFDAETELRIG